MSHQPIYHLGLTIVPHPLAEKVERVARITRNPVAKRRRRWCLRYESVRTPCAFVVGNSVYMRPVLVERLRANSGSAS